MWQQSCSLQQNLKYEYHTKQDAEEGEWLHKMSVLSKTGADCTGHHTIEDDGVPCGYEEATGRKCRFEYVSDIRIGYGG